MPSEPLSASPAEAAPARAAGRTAPRLVMKFGGTSVADLTRIRAAAARVAGEVANGYDVAVVVSAMAGETNKLVGFVGEAAAPPGSNGHGLYDAREYDAVVAAGEQVTAGLMALALQEQGVSARSWLGWQIPIRTTGAHGAARITEIGTEALATKFAEGLHAVVAGFQGLAPDGRVSTLGRGGSDTSAVALAAALGAERCDIYTDVDGVYTTDPRIERRARKLARIGYEEMLELASLGAKVLQTRSVELAMRYKVRLQVRSSFADAPGTLVCDEEELMEQNVVSGIAHSREEAKAHPRQGAGPPGRRRLHFRPPRRGGRQCRHDRPEHRRGRDDGHDLLHRPRRCRARARRAGSRAPVHPLHRSRGGRGRGQGLDRRHRHAQPCRRGAEDVRGPRR